MLSLRLFFCPWSVAMTMRFIGVGDMETINRSPSAAARNHVRGILAAHLPHQLFLSLTILLSAALLLGLKTPNNAPSSAPTNQSPLSYYVFGLWSAFAKYEGRQSDHFVDTRIALYNYYVLPETVSTEKLPIRTKTNFVALGCLNVSSSFKQ